MNRSTSPGAAVRGVLAGTCLAATAHAATVGSNAAGAAPVNRDRSQTDVLSSVDAITRSLWADVPAGVAAGTVTLDRCTCPGRTLSASLAVSW